MVLPPSDWEDRGWLALQLVTIMQRRAAEEELLAIGEEFRRALISYANVSPLGQQRAPRSLQDLVKDPRFPQSRRHLRKIYADPITGKEEWGTVTLAQGGGIIAIHSTSDMQPIKVGKFDPAFQHFADKKTYQDWKFSITPIGIVPGQTGLNAPPGQAQPPVLQPQDQQPAAQPAAPPSTVGSGFSIGSTQR